jgi:RNA polymerase sigma factor (sigma-70 family)
MFSAEPLLEPSGSPLGKQEVLTDDIVDALTRLREHPEDIVDFLGLSSKEIRVFAEHCEDLTDKDRRTISMLQLAAEKSEARPRSSHADGWESDQAIYARFAGPLSRFLGNKVPPGERDEVLQDTFLRFMAKRSKGQILDRQGRPFASPGPLLFGIARMLLLELLRKLAKADSVDDILDKPLADFAPGLHTLISREEQNSIVHECLREIPFHQQMVLECHYMQKMSYLELTQLLGVPLGTIASWCRRGRKNLKARLEKASASKKAPAALLNADPEVRSDAFEAYTWYEPASGAIDAGELLRSVLRHDRKTAHMPVWFAALELPQTLPEAAPTDLYEISRAVWDAWVGAGKPAT